jgi:glycosyltransferase involved in cell wall biosynthesis
MKFSIVTISFNQVEFIETAIQSVLSQDVDLEYIVVDPGSSDGSREIIEKYRDRIDHIVFEPDKGPADGLNKGFALATGDVLGCLNSDDFYFEGGLKRAEVAIKAAPSAGAWIGAGYIVDRGGNITKPCFSAKFTPRLYALGYSVAVHQSTFYDRAAFEHMGRFNSASKATWDGEILYWMARDGYEIARNFEIIGAFRLYEESITGSGRLSDGFLEDFKRLRADLDQVTNPTVNRWMQSLNNPLSRSVSDIPLALRKIAARFQKGT